MTQSESEKWVAEHEPGLDEVENVRYVDEPALREVTQEPGSISIGHLIEAGDEEPEPESEPIGIEPEEIAQVYTVGREEFDEVARFGPEAQATHLAELLAEHGEIRVSEAVVANRDLLPKDARVSFTDAHGSVYVWLLADCRTCKGTGMGGAASGPETNGQCADCLGTGKAA